MSRGQRAVCDWCYHMFLMAPNARLRLCPECKAEYRRMKSREAARKKRETVQPAQGRKKKPEYTISEVLAMQQEHRDRTGQWLSYGEMSARLGKKK